MACWNCGTGADQPLSTRPARPLSDACAHARSPSRCYTYVFLIFTIGLFSIMFQFPFFLFSQIFLNLKETRNRWPLLLFKHLQQHILISKHFIKNRRNKIKLKINLKKDKIFLSQRFNLSISYEEMYNIPPTKNQCHWFRP